MGQGDRQGATYLRDDFGYYGFIGLYIDGAPDLARYRALSGSEGAGEKP